MPKGCCDVSKAFGEALEIFRERQLHGQAQTVEQALAAVRRDRAALELGERSVAS